MLQDNLNAQQGLNTAVLNTELLDYLELEDNNNSNIASNDTSKSPSIPLQTNDANISAPQPITSNISPTYEGDWPAPDSISRTQAKLDVIEQYKIEYTPEDVMEDTTITLELHALGLEDTLPANALFDFHIYNVPEGSVFSHGMQISANEWVIDDLAASEFGSLTFIPPQDFNGQIDLQVSATAEEGTPEYARVFGQTLKMDEAEYDFVVDPINGDDSNDGSPESPFASLTKLKETLEDIHDGGELNIYIKEGEYIQQNLDLRFYGINATDPENPAVVNLIFEPGSTMDWAQEVSASGIQSNNENSHVFIYGQGLHITGFGTGTGNGIGGFKGTVVGNDLLITDVVDGISFHSTTYGEAHRVTVVDATKYAIAHVNDSSSYMTNIWASPADDAVGGLVFFDSDDGHVLENVVFLPSPNGIENNVSSSGPVIIKNSQLGGLGENEEIVFTGGLLDIQNSFLSATAQGNVFLNLDKIFGELSIRARNGGEININDSVLVGSDFGDKSFIYANHDFGELGLITVQDSVIAGYTMGASLGNQDLVDLWLASGSFIDDSNLFFNITDLDSFAAQASTISPTTGVDPLLGSADSTDMADYAVGNTGTDAGFTAAEATETGLTAGFNYGTKETKLSFSFNVVAVNDAPIALDDTFESTASGGAIILDLLANDHDVEGGLTITSIDNSTMMGTVTLDGNGQVTYDASSVMTYLGDVIVDTGTYTVMDSDGMETTATFTVTYTDDTYNVITGDENANTIDGTNGADQINGAGGYDIINGLGGDDIIVGGDGNDTIYGGDGDDVLIGDSGSDMVKGGAGNDTLMGGTGQNFDQLFGEEGDDILIMEDGNNAHYGGAGADSFVFDESSENGFNLLKDFKIAENDLISFQDILVGFDATQHSLFDYVTIRDNISHTRIDIDRDGAGTEYSNRGYSFIYGDERGLTLDQIAFQDSETYDVIHGTSANETLNGASWKDNISGGDGRDNIYGHDGDDILSGEAGNDTLYGGEGDDILSGGTGSDGDSLYGDAGDDTLMIEGGSDALFGGAGADLFQFTADSENGFSLLKDFNVGEGDRISFADVLLDFDPMQDVLSDFVEIIDNTSHTRINIDRDGAGTEYSARGYAFIYGDERGLTLDDVTTDGEIIV